MIKDSVRNCFEPVDFFVSKIKNSKSVWVDEDFIFKVYGGVNESFSLDKFCYANPKSQCFMDIEFNNNDVKSASAERYGGVGVGENGGGVRCGNFSGYQIKGTGVNPLLGNHKDYNHSTGRYPLGEAFFETVCSVVYNIILPLGVVKIYALFYIGKSRHANDRDGKEYPLAMAVREKCLRPAHLLPQPLFRPINRFNHIFRSDLARLRSVNKSFFSKFESDSDLIVFFGEFLSASAKQLAFSKLFRIAHGAYSSSNVCLDGRWLDLTNMTMVPAGLNYAANYDTVAFLNEPHAPVEMVHQALYNLGKFNNKDFNIQPLVRYYYEQFQAYINRYSPLVIGLPAEFSLEDELMVSVNILSKVMVKYINGNRQKEVDISSGFESHNDYVRMLETIFSFYRCKHLKHDGSLMSVELIFASQEIFESSYRNFSEGYRSLKTFVKSCLIRSLRKAYTMPLFVRDHIEGCSSEVVEKCNLEEMKTLINQFKSLSLWVFDKSDFDSRVVIFKSSEVFVFYCYVNDRVNIRSCEEDVSSVSEDLAIIQIEKMHESEFEFCGYPCKSIVLKLVYMLKEIELRSSCEKDIAI